MPSLRPFLLLLALGTAGSAAAQKPSAGLVLSAHGAAEGTLSAANETLAAGEYLARYTLSITDGAPFEVVLTSSDFDPYLIVVAPSGAQYDNDDWEGARSESRVQVRPEQAETGTWRVTVTTYAPGETGAYRLEHRAPTAPVANPVAAPPEPAPGLVLDANGTVAGALTTADRTISSGEYVVSYTLDLADGGAFEIDLTASAFDPYLIVVAPSGVKHENDDWAGRYGSRVHVPAGAGNAGRWTVHVTTYAAGETGAFRLGHRALTPDAYVRALADTDALARADSLRDVWRGLYDAGRYAEAVTPARAMLSLREGALGSDHPAVAQALNDLAITLKNTSDFAGARAGYERVIAVWEAALGPEHPDVAAAMHNLASLLSDLDEHAAARALFERTLALRERVLGPYHLDVAKTLNNFAEMLRAQGDYAEARRLHERALAVREAAVGPDHPDVATSLNNLAVVLNDQGDFLGARRHYERALAIREAALGPDHLDVANSLGNLAALVLNQGDYTAARALLERSLAIREAVLGPGHPDVALSLNALAALLDDLGDYEASGRLHERALAIREAVLGPNHLDVAASLNNLAALRSKQGDPAAARPLHERALAIREAVLGPNHLDVATSLNNLAVVLGEEGDEAAAGPLRVRALAIREARLGADHPDVALSLTNLAVSTFESGDHDEAAGLALRAARAYDAAAVRLLPTLSAAEQRAFVDLSLGDVSAFLLSLHTGGPGLRDAYAVVGGWKGLLLDGLRRQAAVTALAADPAYAADVVRLQALRAQVARAFRAGDPAGALTEEKERLERRLAAALPDGVAADPWRAAGLDGLEAALPEGSAFADVFRYHRWEAGGAGGGLRYGAVVIPPGQDTAPVLVDLGPAEALEAAVAAWREAVTRGEPPDAEALATALWAPLAAALPPATTRVWLSPDGDLVRVPWAALAADHADTADLLVAQVPSARALLALLTTEPGPAASRSLLLVGGVDFGGGSGGFAPLPGTEAEVEALAALAEAERLEPTILTGAAATSAAVAAALPQAAYAHLATHGFFYGESGAAYEARGGAGPFTRTDVLGAPARASEESNRNPLAESGLALAGANDDAAEGGTLTAEELVGLDLSRTRLVVLSACETGRGTEVTGQGVLGLQASFTAAGARSLLMSLWSVPDASTAALMTAFYRGLWEGGLAPAEALRSAQAEVRAQPAWAAPVHWAAWVLSGDAF